MNVRQKIKPQETEETNIFLYSETVQNEKMWWILDIYYYYYYYYHSPLIGKLRYCGLFRKQQGDFTEASKFHTVRVRLNTTSADFKRFRISYLTEEETVYCQLTSFRKMFLCQENQESVI